MVPSFPLLSCESSVSVKKNQLKKIYAFNKSRFFMTFSTILGVTEILCSFKLVLQGKTGKEIPESSRLEFIEKFSANNFALSDAEDNNSRPLNRGGIADLSFYEGYIHQFQPKPTYFHPKTLKYWIGVQQGQSYLMGRRCLFSLGW